MNPWATPWPTPTPEHIRKLHAPLAGEDVELARPYVLAEMTMVLGVIVERRRAAEAAARGADYPYGYEGDQFSRLRDATAAVSA